MAFAAHKTVRVNATSMRHARPFGDDATATSNIKSRRLWQDIARDVTREQDPVKLLELSKELNDSMVAEEREKVLIRLGHKLKPKPTTTPK
jgi:hypothetical protein